MSGDAPTLPFEDRTILVTGGTGSIGSVIVERLLMMGPRVIRVFSRDDTKQFDLVQELGDHARLRMLIGDVRSASRLRRAMSGVNLVFHAAALKHVPAAEFNPFEATETNVRGTQNVVEAAIDAGVDRVLTISTDKAVNPVNVMGATKLLAERLMTAAEGYKGAAATRFAAVRFGNVIGSRGSIVPLVRRQVAAGGPVTLTDPEMTRYIMPIGDAVGLCFEAMRRMEGGEIFILKMPRVRIGDLVEVLVEAYAPELGRRPDEIEIQIIGARPGEKAHEHLMTSDEEASAVDLGDMYVVNAPGAAGQGSVPRERVREPAPLSKDEIREVLAAAGYLDRSYVVTPV